MNELERLKKIEKLAEIVVNEANLRLNDKCFNNFIEVLSEALKPEIDWLAVTFGDIVNHNAFKLSGKFIRDNNSDYIEVLSEDKSICTWFKKDCTVELPKHNRREDDEMQLMSSI